MNLGEIKKLIDISGGKLILSDGDLKESFIVMRISDYLSECKCEDCNCDCFFDEEDDVDEADLIMKGDDQAEKLTDGELLDKINTDIEELKRRKQENELTSVMESEFFDSQKEEELNYEKI